MIFVGDISLPNINAVQLKDLPGYFKNKTWFGNLEGSLIINADKCNIIHGVYNDFEAIKELGLQTIFSGLALANNHLFDATTLENTIVNLDALKIPYVGAGINKKVASEPLIIDDINSSYIILNFGWEAIRCKVASTQRTGVNGYVLKNVLESIEQVINRYKNYLIVCYFHWNYEFELFPQPADRELAHKLIELGVDAVIGTHSHRVQPIEFYKGKPIIFGLGNWLFRQGAYFNNSISYPAFTNRQLAFEIDDTGGYQLHWFDYNPREQVVRFIESEKLNDYYYNLAQFSNLSALDYISWFRRYRIQKKLLPVFLAGESPIITSCKIFWVKRIRHFFVAYINQLKNILKHGRN